MLRQTIALFRYQLLGLIHAKFLLLMLLVYLTAFLAGQFVAELAIINSEAIAFALTAEILRYSLVVVVIVSLSHQVSQDYELSQFERLLAMPIHRGQYIFAQNLVLLVFLFSLIFPVLLLMAMLGEAHLAIYWSLALFLELVLVGQFAVLAIVSLEKLPLAVLFTLAIYLLARVSPVLDVVFMQSKEFYEQQGSFQITHYVFSLIQYVMPDGAAFARNDVLFDSVKSTGLLGRQLVAVLIYALFIQFVILIDFYRKEFNRT